MLIIATAPLATGHSTTHGSPLATSRSSPATAGADGLAGNA